MSSPRSFSVKASRPWSVWLLVFLMCLVVVGSAFATNGYFRHGYGTKNKGLAGAGVAFPLNTMIAVTNPAGMVFLGKRYDIGISIFNPNRSYTIVGNPSGFPGTFGLAPGKVESGSKPFVIPSFGANWMVSDAGAIGLSIFGNGGMNTNYPTNTFGASQPTGVDLMQLFVALTYSHKFGGKHSLGVTPMLGVQLFEIKGVGSFAPFSRDPNNLSNNGKDAGMGFGLRVGYMGDWLPWLSVGGSFQTKIYMSKFDKYAGLFAEQGGFDVPMNWVVGLALKPSEKLALLFDVQGIQYSGVKSVGNPLNLQTLSPILPDGSPNPNFTPLGSDNASGFGWRDMTVFKFGLQYAGGGGWTWRAGYSYGKQPIPSTEVLFNILAPGVMEQHITLGLTKELNKGKEVSLALMFAPNKKVSGPNPLEAPNQQTIVLEMNQWEVDVSFGF